QSSARKRTSYLDFCCEGSRDCLYRTISYVHYSTKETLMFIIAMLLIFCVLSTIYLIMDRAFRWSWLYLPGTMLGYLVAVLLASGWPTSAPLPNPAVVFSAVPGAGVVASPVDTYAPRF